MLNVLIEFIIWEVTITMLNGKWLKNINANIRHVKKIKPANLWTEKTRKQ